jgi:hypothetical protein
MKITASKKAVPIQGRPFSSLPLDLGRMGICTGPPWSCSIASLQGSIALLHNKLAMW